MSCSTIPQRTERQKKINAYLQAVQVVKALKRDGKLDDVCKVKGIPIPLYKNIVGIVWGNSEIDYGVAKKQIRKISFKQVVKDES